MTPKCAAINLAKNLESKFFSHIMNCDINANIFFESDKWNCLEAKSFKIVKVKIYFFCFQVTFSTRFQLSSSFFSVQLRTTPRDSTGVAHILEHTVLCGSEKYPVRDPFFKMLSRSLSTFMNALTGMYCLF